MCGAVLMPQLSICREPCLSACYAEALLQTRGVGRILLGAAGGHTASATRLSDWLGAERCSEGCCRKRITLASEGGLGPSWRFCLRPSLHQPRAPPPARSLVTPGRMPAETQTQTEAEAARTLPGIDRGKHCQHACGAVARFKLSFCVSVC